MQNEIIQKNQHFFHGQLHFLQTIISAKKTQNAKFGLKTHLLLANFHPLDHQIFIHFNFVFTT